MRGDWLCGEKMDEGWDGDPSGRGSRRVEVNHGREVQKGDTTWRSIKGEEGEC